MDYTPGFYKDIDKSYRMEAIEKLLGTIPNENNIIAYLQAAKFVTRLWEARGITFNN